MHRAVVLLLAASVASSAAAAVPGTHRIVVPVAVAVPVVTASQYHAQDESGRASFGYAHPGHVAAHRRDHLGHQVGSWAYVDANDREVLVSYVADAHGFRVLSNVLPQAPHDTPEVQAAKAAHAAAHAAAKAAAAKAAEGHAVQVAHADDKKEAALDDGHAAVVVPTVAVVHKKEPVDRPVLPFHYVAPVFHKRETHEEPVVQQDVAPVVQVVVPVAAPSLTSVSSFHSQDEAGRASYGHSTPDQAHKVFIDDRGNRVGAFYYINPDGKEVRTYYTAGVDGYQVYSNALPLAPSAEDALQQTPEVEAARKTFFAKFEEARNIIKHKTPHH